MTLFFISFLAGVLTVLAPCILPLLPVVVGRSVGAHSKMTPFVVIGSLALSILLFTYLLKASTALIAIPPAVWGYISGGILVAIGLALLFPQLSAHLPRVKKTNQGANQLLGAGYQKQNVWGDVMVGAALGPVFSSCSPTYFVILATVLPASFALGSLYLFTYIAGLVLVLGLIALFGQRLTRKLQFAADNQSAIKRGVGALILIVGVLVATGYDKRIEAWMLDRGYLEGVIDFEEALLDEAHGVPNAGENQHTPETAARATTAVEVPPKLARAFPRTDFTQADPNLANAVAGGPPKDGIPAIDDPKFVPLSAFDRPDSVQAIVLEGDNTTKVYPYNILVWHEIVNDEIDGTPVAVTFCPLCGSAIVYNRTLPDGTVSTFGVSGALLESNLIMYDRATENLWQQSTGETLAGSFHPATLTLEPFQLLTLGAIRETYPNAEVLSEDTGYRRDYARNPYAGYDETDDFIIPPSSVDTTFEPKTIMAVFRDAGTTVAAPWLSLREAGGATVERNERTYTLTVTENGELTVQKDTGEKLPFYFEMWFSVAAQHHGALTVVEL